MLPKNTKNTQRSLFITRTATISWAGFFIWYGIILYFSSIPNLRISPDVQTDEVLRIPAHFIEYCILAILFINALGRTVGKINFYLVFFFLFALSLIDECWQSTISTRTFQIKDLVWDNIGNIIVIGLAMKLPTVIKMAGNKK